MTDFSPCDDCECFLGEDEELHRGEVEHDLRVENALRGYIIEQLDLEDDHTFFKKIILCPEKIEVAYVDKS
jgi:hypothetical protein